MFDPSARSLFSRRNNSGEAPATGTSFASRKKKCKKSALFCLNTNSESQLFSYTNTKRTENIQNSSQKWSRYAFRSFFRSFARREAVASRAFRFIYPLNKKCAFSRRLVGKEKETKRRRDWIRRASRDVEKHIE